MLPVLNKRLCSDTHATIPTYTLCDPEPLTWLMSTFNASRTLCQLVSMIKSNWHILVGGGWSTDDGRSSAQSQSSCFLPSELTRIYLVTKHFLLELGSRDGGEDIACRIHPYPHQSPNESKRSKRHAIISFVRSFAHVCSADGTKHTLGKPERR